MTDIASLNEYKTYVESLSIKELMEIKSYVDRDRYPERYDLVARKLEAELKKTEKRDSGKFDKKITESNDNEIVEEMHLYPKNSLPLIQIIKKAFLIVWKRRINIIFAMAIPCCILLILELIKTFVFINSGVFVIFLFYLLETLVMALFILTCHRLFIFGKGSVPKYGILTPRNREIRFFGWLVTANLIMIIIISPIALLFTFLEVPKIIERALTFLPIAYVFSRLSLLLPATAVDQHPNMKWAWNQSQGNGMKFFVLLAIPLISQHSISILIDKFESSTTITIFLVFVMLFFATVGIAFISIAFKELCMQENRNNLG